MQVQDVNDRPPPPEASTAGVLPVRAFLSGRADDLVVDLLAYALYMRDREGRGTAHGEGTGGEDPVQRFRREAVADLTNFTFRFFHNKVEEIRIGAVREHLGGLPRPPGFLRIFAASALAVGIVGAAALWAMGQGGLLSEMAARVMAVVNSLRG